MKQWYCILYCVNYVPLCNDTYGLKQYFIRSSKYRAWPMCWNANRWTRVTHTIEMLFKVSAFSLCLTLQITKYDRTKWEDAIKAFFLYKNLFFDDTIHIMYKMISSIQAIFKLDQSVQSLILMLVHVP